MPMVEAVKVRLNRKTGRFAISFEVDPKTMENMRDKAKEGAFFDIPDFIAGTLNTAFLECFPPPAKTPEAEKKPGDKDDDIPF
jgi:hypothetical protein